MKFNHWIRNWSLAGLVFGISHGAVAKTWNSDFISIELPEGWSCNREEIDYVCQPDSLKERSEALIVIVVKSANEVDDKLEKYDDVLKQTREMYDLTRQKYTSEVKYVKRMKINGREWVDSLHKGSEIPGFYTRYLASINEKVAGLVTYSIAESVFAKYGEMLDAAVRSLKLEFNEKKYQDAMNANPSSLLPKGSLLSGRRRTDPKVDDSGDEKTPETNTDIDPATLAVFALLAGGIGFYIWKKRRGG
jgi:hypothetical protein